MHFRAVGGKELSAPALNDASFHAEAAVKGISLDLLFPPALCDNTVCSLAVMTLMLAASSRLHITQLIAQPCRLPCAQCFYLNPASTLQQPCLSPACWPAGGTAAAFVAGQNALLVAGASAPGEIQLTTVSLGHQSTATSYKVPLHADSFPQASEAAIPITGVWASSDGAR